jgi:uncharacterized protein (TIGR02246 family)
MKHAIMAVMVLIALASCKNESKHQTNKLNQNTMEQTTEKTAIENLLFAYRDALNASDVSKVMPLYTSDGVFMPSSAPSAVGREQVKGAYEFVFKNIQLNIAFFIDEIEVIGDYAFARTISKGSTLIHANGQTVAEENRELFILQKVDGQWKISRYMFNKMQ